MGVAESAEAQAYTLPTAGDTTNAAVYRLYEAAFGRTPDSTGQASWGSLLNSGGTLTQAAQGFVDSAEFQHDYGQLSPADFVTALYQNALHRAPDGSERQGWVSALQGGASEASVLVGFSDGIESRVMTASATHANWVFIPA